MSDTEDPVVVPFDGSRKALTRTLMVVNNRRYDSQRCPHKGPFLLSKEEWSVECGDCGALLNPIWCLMKLANKEAYWNQRLDDLREYVTKLDEEIKGRERTKCTHCGNMTAIRYKTSKPQTWYPKAD